MERLYVRTALYFATKADIHAANDARARAGRSTRFSFDIERTCEEVRTATQFTILRLREWVAHPDERVPLALLENPNLPPFQSLLSVYISAALTARCLMDVRDHGWAWTPLLDRSRFFHWAQEYELVRWVEKERVQNPPEFVPIDLLIRPIGDYLKSTDDPELIEELLMFSDPSLLCAVADNVQSVPDSILDHALSTPRFAAGDYCLAAP